MEESSKLLEGLVSVIPIIVIVAMILGAVTFFAGSSSGKEEEEEEETTVTHPLDAEVSRVRKSQKRAKFTIFGIKIK